jgi:hypothetical protein
MRFYQRGDIIVVNRRIDLLIKLSCKFRVLVVTLTGSTIGT